MKNKIAVIGGTGKAGRFLVNQFIKQNIPIKILVRNPERITFTGSFIEIVQGDVTSTEAVQRLLDGCYALVSTLGMGQPPSEPTIFSKATANIIKVMNEYDLHRYVVITGLNVDTPSDKKGPKSASATEWMYANYPLSTKDKQTEYEMLTECNLDWTMVRLPMIELSDAGGEVRISLEDCPGDQVSADVLAQFLIEQIKDNTFIRKAPFIATS